MKRILLIGKQEDRNAFLANLPDEDNIVINGEKILFIERSPNALDLFSVDADLAVTINLNSENDSCICKLKIPTTIYFPDATETPLQFLKDALRVEEMLSAVNEVFAVEPPKPKSSLGWFSLYLPCSTGNEEWIEMQPMRNGKYM